jgi:hypothetical protein
MAEARSKTSRQKPMVEQIRWLPWAGLPFDGIERIMTPARERLAEADPQTMAAFYSISRAHANWTRDDQRPVSFEGKEGSGEPASVGEAL